MSLLWTADRLATHHFANPFLIEPIVPKGGIVLFYGKRGIGKSHFALTVAACLSSRGVLFGRYPVHPLGPVIYVQADMTPSVTQERVRRTRKLYSLDHVFFHFPGFLNMTTLTPEHELVKEIVALHPALVIWDTLRKIHRAGSNDDDTPSLIYGWAKHLFPTATHLFIHHDKKTIAEQDQLDEEELFRGSGAWLDDADTGLRLSEIVPGKLVLTFTKTRTCEDQQQLMLSLNLETLLLYAQGDSLDRLTNWYRQRHPAAPMHDLEQFLLASFVGSPRLVREWLAAPMHAPTGAAAAPLAAEATPLRNAVS